MPTLIFVRPPAGGAPFHWAAEHVTIPAAGETFIDVVYAPVTLGRFPTTLQIESLTAVNTVSHGAAVQTAGGHRGFPVA